MLDPIRIGNCEIKNRAMMAAMTTRLASPTGYVTEELLAYYEARAAGGVGLVTVELSSPHPSGAHRARELGVYDDRFLNGLARLVEIIHRHGAKASIQIGHAGAHARPDVTGFQAIGPSQVPHAVQEGEIRSVTPRALATDEIPSVVEWYAGTFDRLGRAGFDVVEVQGGHDYLIYQFLSPLDNERRDRYGGSLENRARLAIEIIEACKRRVPTLPISFRYSADEFAAGGFTSQDGLRVATLVEEAGVDLINVSAGSARSSPIPWLITTPMAYPRGLFVPLAEEIRKRVDIPVSVGGRIDNHDLAERLIAEGRVDMVTLGRPLLADPDWVRKAFQLELGPVRPCIACNTCVDHLRSGRQVQCLVNPTIGTEPRTARPATTLRDVLVVGGGPAGLTAACELALQGHRVTLHEASPTLGGRLKDIHKAPYFQVVETAVDTFEQLIDYLVMSASRAGVDIRAGSSLTAQHIIEAHPDVAVIATGAVYPVPGLLNLLRIPGARKLAAMKRMRKLFFKVLRTPEDGVPEKLAEAGIETHIVGDRSGSRGVQAAIAAGNRVADIL